MIKLNKDFIIQASESQKLRMSMVETNLKNSHLGPHVI